MALPKLEGEIILSAATLVGTFGGFNVTMPAGRYFLNSTGSGGATNSFLEVLEDQVDAVLGAGSDFQTYDNSDTQLGTTLLIRGGIFAVNWSSTAIRDLLGFTGNLSGAASYQSPGSAKHIWLPNCGRAGVLSPTASSGALESDFTLALGTDGTPFGLGYTVRGYDSLEFRHLRGKKVWSSQATVANEAFESFWRNTIALGLRIRYHADRTIDGTYRTWVVEDAGRFAPEPFDENWTEGPESLWSIRYRVRETT